MSQFWPKQRFVLFLLCKLQGRKFERPKRSSLIIGQSWKYWKALCGCLMLFLMALRTCSFHVCYQKFASLMLVFLCVGAYVCALCCRMKVSQANALVLGNRFFPLCASGLEVQTSFCVIARAERVFAVGRWSNTISLGEKFTQAFYTFLRPKAVVFVWKCFALQHGEFGSKWIALNLQNDQSDGIQRFQIVLGRNALVIIDDG